MKRLLLAGLTFVFAGLAVLGVAASASSPPADVCQQAYFLNSTVTAGPLITCPVVTAPTATPTPGGPRMAFSASPLVEFAVGSTDKSGFTSSAVDSTGVDLLVFGLVGDNSSVAPSDSKGNTWVKADEGNSFGVYAGLWYVKNPTVGSGHTFTVTATNNSPAMYVAGWSGADLTAPLSAVNHGGGGFGSTGQPGSVTPGADGALLVTIVNHGTSTASIDTGYTVNGNGVGQVVQVDNAHYGIAGAYFIQTTAAAINPTWSSNNITGMVHASFLAAAGGAVAANPGLDDSADSALAIVEF